jgi:hypothetical protein
MWRSPPDGCGLQLPLLHQCHRARSYFLSFFLSPVPQHHTKLAKQLVNHEHSVPRPHVDQFLIQHSSKNSPLIPLNQIPYGVELPPAHGIERPRIGICLGDFIAIDRVFARDFDDVAADFAAVKTLQRL